MSQALTNIFTPEVRMKFSILMTFIYICHKIRLMVNSTVGMKTENEEEECKIFTG